MTANGKTFTLEGVEIPQELLSQPSVYQVGVGPRELETFAADGEPCYLLSFGVFLAVNTWL